MWAGDQDAVLREVESFLNSLGAAHGARLASVGEDGLTERELEVLRLMTAGWTNKQIAGALFISPKTAGAHVSNILSKLGVARRGGAAAAAQRLGLINPSAQSDGVPPGGER